MISKEKSKTLDKILKHLHEIEKQRRFANVEDIAKLVDSDFHTAFHLSDILIKNDLIDHRDTSSKNGKSYLININSNGIVFINSDGGFTKLFNIQDAKRIKEEEFKELQLTALKNRVENLENTIKEQSEFWTSTTEKNKEQIPLIKVEKWIIWITLGIAILSLLKSYSIF